MQFMLKLRPEQFGSIVGKYWFKTKRPKKNVAWFLIIKQIIILIPPHKIVLFLDTNLIWSNKTMLRKIKKLYTCKYFIYILIGTYRQGTFYKGQKK